MLYETVPIPNAPTKAGRERAEREAYKEAQKILTRLQAEADALKVGRTKATVEALLECWLEQHEVDPTTRMNYESQIRRYIVPNLGDVPLVLFVRDAPERLEKLYARLRKCRALCSGRPFVERHAEDGPHDCAAASCQLHVCKPYAASSVRQIHAILSGALSAAVRWGWIAYNPMSSVKPPAQEAPATAAADEQADGAHRRDGLARLTGVGPVPVALGRHRRAPRRGGRAAVGRHRPRRRRGAILEVDLQRVGEHGDGGVSLWGCQAAAGVEVGSDGAGGAYGVRSRSMA